MITLILVLDTLLLGSIAVLALVQAGGSAAKLEPGDSRRMLFITAGCAAGCLALAFASVGAVVGINR